MSTPLPEDVRAAIAAGDVAEAVRLIRRQTHLGLGEAMDLVRRAALAEHAHPASGGELPPDVVNALAAGQPLEAIRRLRAVTGVSLKEAQGRVQAAGRAAKGHTLQRQRPLVVAPGDGTHSPLRMVLLVLILLGAVGAMALLWLEL